MKKICAILLALTLALSLVACGTSGSTDTNINTDSDTDTAQAASLLTSVDAPDLTDAAVILLGGDAVQITGSGAAAVADAKWDYEIAAPADLPDLLDEINAAQ